MRKTANTILILICLGVMLGCISNDLPYPVIEAGIVSMDVENASSVSIDAARSRVDIVLNEAADIRNVNVRSIGFNHELVQPSWDLTGRHDLSSKVKLTLHSFDDYVWEISTSQPVERYFTVADQVGDSEIDEVNRRVMLKVSPSADLENLSVTSCKLGLADISSYQPEPESLHDFSDVRTVKVSCRDEVQDWNIYVEQVSISVRISSLDPWARVAWIKAFGPAGADNGFRYRKAGSGQWLEAEGVRDEGGVFSVALEGLEPDTRYECVAYSGSEETEIREFWTEREEQVPNAGFETFSNTESSKYYSFFDPASADPALRTKWWGSGNKGSTTVGSSFAITMPDNTTCTEGEHSLLMASAYVVIKFAAGNIFSGEYYKTIGTSGGVIRLGRPFTARPRSLVLKLKYKGGIITDKTLGGKPESDPVKVGDRDRGSVWVALGTWDYRKYGGSPESPVEINTTDRSTFFDPASPDVIAYGRFIAEKDIDEWTRVEIPLDYVSTSRKPTHIIISAASSMLGDYFTGSADSKMWIDDIQLVY